MVMWIFFTLASAFTLGLRDVLVKKLFKNRNISSTQVIFEEYFMLFLIVIILFFPHVDFYSYKEYWFFYLMKTLTLMGFTIIYFKLLKKYDISSISPLMNLSPIILLVLSDIYLGEMITSTQFVGVLFIIISTYILEVNFHHDKKNDPHKNHFEFLKKLKFRMIFQVFVMLVLISITAIADKLVLGEVNVYTNMYFTGLLIFLFLLVYYLKEGKLKEAFKNIVDEPETLLISILMILSTFLVLVAIAIPTALVSLIVPLKRTSTLFSSIFGGILFHEKHLKRKIYSTIGMLVGVLLIAL